MSGIGRRRAAFLALLAVLVVGCGTDPEPENRVAPSDLPPADASLSPEPDPEHSPPPEPGAQTQVAVPVYYVAENASGWRLQREFHRISTTDPGSDAVREMLAHPTGTDPDYRTHWPQGTALRVPVTEDGGVIVVDLTDVGPAQVGSGLAELTVQQLVFTVQGALQSDAPVRIVVDGQPVPELWGAVDTSEPLQRGDPYRLRSLVQIDTPAEGAVVGRDVEVTGVAAVFEATVRWEVLRADAVVQSGFTTAAEGQRFSPYAFTVTLEPGEYTVRVLEDDPSDGEGRPVLSDDKTITVAS